MGHDLHPDPRLGHARRLRGSAVASLSPRPAAALLQPFPPQGLSFKLIVRAAMGDEVELALGAGGTVEVVKRGVSSSSSSSTTFATQPWASSVTQSHFSRRAALAAFLLRLLPRRRRVRAAYARAQAVSGAAMLLAEGELTIALSSRSDWPYDGVQKLRMFDERLLLKNRASRSLQPEPRAASPAHLNRTVERIRCSRAARNGPCRDRTPLLIGPFHSLRAAPGCAPDAHGRAHTSTS
jgi:hypothetical protein